VGGFSGDFCMCEGFVFNLREILLISSKNQGMDLA
jgi:hypothetical protein